MDTNGISAMNSESELRFEYIKDNLLSLRRRLKLSQGEFIARYLSDENGKAMISVPKLSNLENKGGHDADRISGIVAKKISADASVFLMHPDKFAKNLDLFIESELNAPHRLLDSLSPVSPASYVETLVRVMSDYLSDSILAGELKPGDKLPSDRALSAQFNVGRTSIREALKVLSVLGLINIRPGQGTFICPDGSSFFLMPLSWTFFMGDRNVDNVIDVRNTLEIESAKLAAQNAKPENLEHFAEIFSQTRKAYLESNFQDFLDLDLDFHLAIAQCSQNPIICDLLLTTRKLVRYISKSGMVNLEQLKNIYTEHTRIYETIMAQEPIDAARMMFEHLQKSKARYRINK